jgi:mono/diheme cytochrome c family protein
MSRLMLNVLLLLATAVCLGLAWHFSRDVTQPNYELALEAQMARSPAYDSFAPNGNFPDGMTLRTPPAGTIPRGGLRPHYATTPAEAASIVVSALGQGAALPNPWQVAWLAETTIAARAGQELRNPLPPTSPQVRERGALVFATYCRVCHGPTGLGDGPVTRRGVPTPLSMLTGKAVEMKDGEMFRVLTYGQGNMGAYAGQLSPSDRWCVIDHIRRLQKKRAVPPAVLLADTVKLFQTNCAACHGLDGSGSLMRAKYPKIPDFTSRAWQVSQTDLEIISRIDYGDLPEMPTFRYLLAREQILALAAYVRTFAGTKAQPGAPAAPGKVTGNLSPVQIYRANCLACHNLDGRGAIVRLAMPDIPDFTSPQWQASKKDAELVPAILNGGKFMPAMKERGLGPADAEKMVRFVRAFEGGKQVVPLESLEVPKAPVPFPPGIGIVPKGPPGKPPLPGPSVSEEEGRRVRAGAVLFREYCIICHGPDGTGSAMRAQLPPIPDFTGATWQSEHSDPQLLISILDGKGNLMPANRGRVTEAQARDLVAYIRAFGPPGARAASLAPSEFQKRFDALQQQWDALEKQLQPLAPPPGKP